MTRGREVQADDQTPRYTMTTHTYTLHGPKYVDTVRVHKPPAANLYL